MAAEEHLGPQFHVEGDTLHVGGRPFRMAIPASSREGFKVWKVPFESGHEMVVGGGFNEAGENTHAISDDSTGLIGRASHRPTNSEHRFEGTDKAPLGGDIWHHPGGGTSDNREWVNMPTAESFHRRVKEVANLSGGGRGTHVG